MSLRFHRFHNFVINGLVVPAMANLISVVERMRLSAFELLDLSLVSAEFRKVVGFIVLVN